MSRDLFFHTEQGYFNASKVASIHQDAIARRPELFVLHDDNDQVLGTVTEDELDRVICEVIPNMRDVVVIRFFADPVDPRQVTTDTMAVLAWRLRPYGSLQPICVDDLTEAYCLHDRAGELYIVPEDVTHGSLDAMIGYMREGFVRAHLAKQKHEAEQRAVDAMTAGRAIEPDAPGTH